MLVLKVLEIKTTYKYYLQQKLLIAIELKKPLLVEKHCLPKIKFKK